MASAKQLKTEIRFGAKVDPSVRKACANVSQAFRKLDSTVNKTIKGVAAATAAVGAAAAGAMALAVKAGADFEKQMANVATLLDGDVTARVDELGDQILEVKKRTKKPIEDLTNGVYQIISAFGDAPDSAEKLEIAAKAAAAGLAETNDAVNLFAAQMKGYGDTSAEFMRQCADMNFQVVKLGQTSFPELAASLPKVIPIAKMMGVTIQEVNGYMATLTGVTGGAAEVATQMSAALTAFLKPTDKMREKIKALGFADGQAMIKARGLQGSLELLRKTVSTDVEFGNLFGRKEGINFALAATGDLADTVREKTKAMYEASGVMETAFAKQGDNLIGRWKAITNAVETAQIAIGKKLTPALKELAERVFPHVQKWLDELVVRFGEWSQAAGEWVRSIDFEELTASIASAIETVKGWASFVADHIGIIWSLSKAFFAIGVAVKVWTVAQWALNAALSANPIGLVTAAVVALIAAGWLLYDNWEDVCAWCGERWQEFAGSFPETAKFIETLWKNLCTEYMVAWEAVKASLEASGQTLMLAFEVFTRTATLLWDNFCSSFSAAAKLLTGDFEGAKKEIEGMWTRTVAWFDTTLDRFRAYGDSIKAIFNHAWGNIKDIAHDAIEAIMGFLQPLIDKIEAFFDTLERIKNSASDAWEGTKGAASGAWQWVKDKFAAGGFTSGPSLCGEAGTEAVISFDPAHRAENMSYLMTAAEMLGMTAAPRAESRATSYNFGGINITLAGGNSGEGAGAIMSRLRAAIPEIADALEEELRKRAETRYA